MESLSKCGSVVADGVIHNIVYLSSLFVGEAQPEHAETIVCFFGESGAIAVVVDLKVLSDAIHSVVAIT